MKKRILAVSHNAFYGAPRVLIDMCKFLKKQSFEFRFILLEGGPLLHEFKAIGETTLLEHSFGQKVTGGRSLLRYAQGYYEKRECLRRIANGWKPSIIYANTVAVCSTLRCLSSLSVPIILHVHELKNTTDFYCTTFLRDFLNIPTVYIAVSRAVKSHLEKDFGIPAEKVSLLYAAIDTDRIDSLLDSKKDDSRFLKNGHFIVGGAGVPRWDKGVDLWLHVVPEVKRRMRDKRIKFIWIGAKPTLKEGGYLKHLAMEIKGLGIEDDVEFTGYHDNPYPVFNSFDVFALTSREDPCPLVCLENMYLEKPVVAFASGGGIPEVIRHDAGLIIENLNVTDMAEKIAYLLQDKAQRIKIGRLARERIKTEFTIQIFGDSIREIFNRLF